MPLDLLTGAAPVLPTLLMLLKATTILLAALLVALGLHRASASLRHQVWLVALAGLLALPLIATYAPLGVQVLPATGRAATEQPSQARPPAGDPSTASVTNTAVPSADPDRPASATAAHPLPVGAILLGAWAIVAAVLLGRLLLGMFAVRGIVRRAMPLDDEAWQESLLQISDRLGLAEPPRLLRSDAVHMPFAAGVRHALVVLPAEADAWSVAQREAVLIHELGHVRRRDMIGHTLGRLACAVYWFHPMVWSAARRLRDASERACDDLAIRLGAVPSDYAQHLLDIVTTVRNPNTPTAAIAMARRKEFEGRMLAILDPARHRGDAPRWRTALLSAGLAVFVVAVSAAAPVRRATPVTTTAGLPVAPPAAPESAERQPTTTAQPERTTAPVAQPQQAKATLADRVQADILPTVDRLLRENHVQMSVDLGDAGASADEKMDLLIRVLKTDKSPEVRRVAAWGLEHYADEPAAQAELAGVLGTDVNARVRQMAAWALAHGNGTVALDALRQALTRDDDAGVRETAAWALGGSGDSSSASAVVAALDDHSPLVRGTAAWAIGKLAPASAPPALVAMLRSDDAGLRLKAAWALSEIGDRTAIPAIRAALDRTDNDDATSRALLRALVQSGTTTEDLSAFLSSANDELRLFAIKSLSGDGRVSPWPWPWPRPIPRP